MYLPIAEALRLSSGKTVKFQSGGRTVGEGLLKKPFNLVKEHLNILFTKYSQK